MAESPPNYIKFYKIESTNEQSLGNASNTEGKRWDGRRKVDGLCKGLGLSTLMGAGAALDNECDCQSGVAVCAEQGERY